MKTKTQKHTPTPWSVADLTNGVFGKVDIMADGVCVAIVNSDISKSDKGKEEAEANAALIVRAVNAHAKLLTIARAIYNADRTNNNGNFTGEAILCPYFAKMLKAAINEAEGE